MKRMMIALVAVLALLCLLAGCSYPPQTKTATTVVSCSKGETLHIDTRISSGVIAIQVASPDGTIYFEKTVSKDYACGINIYSPGVYTVMEHWENARGNVKVYQMMTAQRDFE